MVAKRKGLPLIYSREATADLEEIYQFRARNESVARAKKVVASILAKAKRIPAHPYLFPSDWGLTEPNKHIRRALVSRTYHIIFEIETDRIRVLRIFHSARNPEDIGSIGK